MVKILIGQYDGASRTIVNAYSSVRFISRSLVAPRVLREQTRTAIAEQFAEIIKFFAGGPEGGFLTKKSPPRSFRKNPPFIFGACKKALP
jgi:hypothetical protein